MDFRNVFSIISIFLPMLFMFVIFSTAFVYIFLFFSHKKFGYLYMLVFSFSFVLYNLFHILALISGFLKNDISFSLFFARLSLVSLMLMFIFISLYSLNQLYKIRKEKIYMYSAYLFLFVTTILVLIPIIFISFIKADLFIPIDKNYNLFANVVSQYSTSDTKISFLYFLFKNYILFFIGSNLIVMLIKVSTDKEISKFNIMTLVFWIISIFFAYEFSKSNIIFLNEYNFSRLSLSIFMFISPYMLILLDTFLTTSLNLVKEQNIFINKIALSKNKIDRAIENPLRVNKLDKHIENSSCILMDVIKENANAINIIYEKLENINTYKYITLDDLQNMFISSIKSLENVFDSFKNSREQIDEKEKFLFNLLGENSKIINESNIQDIIKTLKNISNNLGVESDSVFKKIYLSLSEFYDLDKITETISETITSINEITNKINLLSINSSVQASKAGSFGRSFSIITKEIGIVAVESSKITEHMEKILKDVFNSLIMIDTANQSIKMEGKSLEDYVNITKNGIDKLVSMLEEYNMIYIDNKKILKDIFSQNIFIENIIKQQDSLTASLEKNIASLADIEKNISKNIYEHKSNTLAIIEDIENISKIENDMKNCSNNISKYTSEILKMCSDVHNKLENYIDIEI